MREVNFFPHLQLVPAPNGKRSGGPLADSIHRQDCGLLKWRRKKCARRVSDMMFAEDQPFLPIDVFAELAQTFYQEIFLEKFFFAPQRNRHGEGAEPSGRNGQVSLEQSFKFQQRLVVEDHPIQIAGINRSFPQTVGQRVTRKARVMFLAREPFLLGGRDNFTVVQQSRRAVVIERGDAKNAHWKGSEQRIDERRDRASLREDDEQTKNQEKNEDGNQPEFLSHPHVKPKFFQERHRLK